MMEIQDSFVDGADEKMAANTVQGITLTRRIYTKSEFDDAYKEERSSANACEHIKSKMRCTRIEALKNLLSYIPVIKFVKSYRLKEYILGDLLSGLTVSFMHLPQAMGFGILASLRPINGMYSTFFPVLVYLLFGTSPYMSFGTNALMAILTKNVVEKEAMNYKLELAHQNMSQPTEDQIMKVKVEASMACCVIAGIILMAIGLLKLGIITSYLSASFIGGFTAASAVHIASSQLPTLLGIKIKSFSGPGKLILFYIELFKKIGQTKPADIIIGVLNLVVLLLVKICINERFQSKMKMPVPIDLIMVIIGTIMSHFGNFKERFGVTIVGPIPSGFQSPSLPSFKNAGNFASEAFVMAVLSLAMTISMAKLLANKHGLVMNDNQELIAYGASNLASGFFYCFPAAVAPPRTMILSSLGSRTTLNAVTTTLVFLLVILAIGQLFVSLPLSILGALIIVSMKELLLQYRNLPSIWRINKYDIFIWLVTNSVGNLVDLDYGIIVGVGISIFLVIVLDQISAGFAIGLSVKDDLALNMRQNTYVKEIEGIKIFKLPTNLYFATAERIKNQIYNNTLNPRKVLKKLNKLQTLAKAEDNINELEIKEGELVFKSEEQVNTSVESPLERVFDNEPVKFVILEMSVAQYIDMAGITVLQQVVNDFKQVKIDVYMVAVADRVIDSLVAANFFKDFSRNNMYVDVFDVLSVIQKR